MNPYILHDTSTTRLERIRKKILIFFLTVLHN
jgi:hypothetical protein